LETAIKDGDKDDKAEKDDFKDKQKAAKASGKPGRIAAITYAMQDLTK